MDLSEPAYKKAIELEKRLKKKMFEFLTENINDYLDEPLRSSSNHRKNCANLMSTAAYNVIEAFEVCYAPENTNVFK